MKNVLYDIKKMNGFVLGIGNLSKNILDEFNKNPNIGVSIISNENYSFESGTVEKKKKRKKKKGKNINLKKLKKYFKKNKPDYIVCNISDINDYLKYFIKDSLFITKNKIYIYSTEEHIDLTEIKDKYSRYNVSVKYQKKSLIIDTKDYKKSRVKNILYFIKDTLSDIYNFIGNVITG